MRSTPRDVGKVLGVAVDAVSYASATTAILNWAQDHASRNVFLANVHMVMEAHDDPAFCALINRGDLVTPDGMPLVWVLRRQGYDLRDRVYGPTLMLWVLEAAARAGVPVGFYGGQPSVLAKLVERMGARFPSLRIVFSLSPPFRAMTKAEDLAVVRAINESGARILFVGLGCPKQECWIDDHTGEGENKVRAVMLGVGAAFDFHAGTLRQAPPWMQTHDLEWLFRLAMEPRRLWKRYLKHNPRFAALVLMTLIFKRND